MRLLVAASGAAQEPPARAFICPLADRARHRGATNYTGAVPTLDSRGSLSSHWHFVAVARANIRLVRAVWAVAMPGIQAEPPQPHCQCVSLNFQEACCMADGGPPVESEPERPAAPGGGRGHPPLFAPSLSLLPPPAAVSTVGASPRVEVPACFNGGPGGPEGRQARALSQCQWVGVSPGVTELAIVRAGFSQSSEGLFANCESLKPP